MPLSSDKRASYEVVLRDHEQERDELQQEISERQSRLKEVQNYIAYVGRRLAEDSPSKNPPAQTSSRIQTQRYANMSMRWAILDLLNDDGAMTTAEIAKALEDAGNKERSRAANFANNVSAVLSTTMKEQRKEVEQLPDGRWQLTENGKNSIAYIHTTPKFRRSLPWSTAKV